MKSVIQILFFIVLTSSFALGQTLFTAFDKSDELRKKGDYTSAVRWAEMALKLAEKEFGAKDQAYGTLLNNVAFLYRKVGRYEDAEPLYKQSLTIAGTTSGKNHPDYAASLNNLAELYHSMGRYAEAEPLIKQALSIAKANSGETHPSYATSLSNLAQLYHSMGRYAEAEPLYRQALSIIKIVPGETHPDYAADLTNLALLCKAMGRYEEAEAFYIQATEILRIALGEIHPDYAASLNNFAGFYRTMGRYEKAELLYKQATAIVKAVFGETHPSYATYINNLAGLYSKLGRYREAELLHKRAAEVYKTKLGETHPLYANFLNELAVVYMSTGRYEEAEPLLKEALVIRKTALGETHPDYALALNNLAHLYSYKGPYDEAESLYKKALNIEREVLGETHPGYAISLQNLGALYRQRGRYREATLLLKEALVIQKAAYGETHPAHALVLSSLAILYDYSGYDKEAEAMYQQGNANLLHQIQTYFPFMSEDEKEKFYNTIKERFEGFNSFAVKRSDENPLINAEMYNYQLSIKALLLNSTAKVKRLILGSGDKNLIASYQAWLAQKEYLAKVYALGKTETAKQGINKDSLEIIANDLEQQLSRQSSAFAQARDSALFTWQDIKSRLNPEEAAVEMVRIRWFNENLTDLVYYAALIVRPDSKNYPDLVLLENGNDLEGKYSKDYLECRRAKSGIAYRPYWQYWQPIKEKLSGIKKVYFSPDGIYNQINLNILPNPATGEYVLDEIDIHLVTNTKDLLQFKSKKSANKNAVLFGRPAYQLEVQQLQAATKPFQKRGEAGWLSDHERTELRKASFTDLPGTEIEVKNIGQLLQRNGWQTSVHTGKAALEEAVKAVKNPAILHIATHGVFEQSNAEDVRSRGRNIVPLSLTDKSHFAAPSGTNPMLSSKLLLAGAATYLNAEKKPDTEDGMLTAYEAANLDLDNTELAVLSACETGLGEVKNGEGVYGLQRAFKVSGAKTILMSLWAVDDIATQELMASFYGAWLKTGNKRQAFRQAQQQIRDKYKLPKYWGAFVMVGE